MEVKDKVEKALKRFEQDWCIPPEFAGIDYDALSKQVVAIEGELKHHETPEGKWANFYYGEGDKLVATVASGEHTSVPGKALAIIVSLEEE